MVFFGILVNYIIFLNELFYRGFRKVLFVNSVCLGFFREKESKKNY